MLIFKNYEYCEFKTRTLNISKIFVETAVSPLNCIK